MVPIMTGIHMSVMVTGGMGIKPTGVNPSIRVRDAIMAVIVIFLVLIFIFSSVQAPICRMPDIKY
jgi:hypothetical protein